jgi:hypothetical protein
MYWYNPPMEFKETVRHSLGEKWPTDPKFSTKTGRIILAQKKYNSLQDSFVHSDYNMWCTGINKHNNPNNVPNLPYFNYIESGDAAHFHELFCTEAEAELEAE